MLHTHTPVHGQDPLPRIIERIALPLLLFTAVLFLLLFVSWFGLLPRFTNFHVSDVTLSPTEMAAYAKQMRAQLSAMEETRDRLVLPVVDPAYETLKTEKRTEMRLLEIRSRLQDVAVHLSDAKDAVHIEHLSFDTETQTVAFRGRISGVGPRSMTVLAQYVDAVEKLSMVDHLKRPTFTRVQDDNTTFHSPFSMTFTVHTQP